MTLKIITNNSKLFYLFCKKQNLKMLFIEGHAKDVINQCNALISEGWGLAADPLAGYFSRPNPYHTIFMRVENNIKCLSEDIVRLERTMEQWNRYDNVVPMTDKLLIDYAELDSLIASSTLEGLLKTPFFYSCI